MNAKTSSTIQGLSNAEAANRLARGLNNTAAFKSGRSYLGILRKNVFTFINTILFGISALLVVMGQVEDAWVTAGLVLLNVVVGVYQEGLAKYKLDRLALQVRTRATVVRAGIEKIIEPEEIVQGDVLICRAGDQILADGHLVGSKNIAVDESNLTGESERIYKYAGDPVFSGSYCTAGSGYYEVEKIGAESLVNQMTAAARVMQTKKTPLQRAIDGIIRVLVILATLLGVLLGIQTLLSGTPVVEFIRTAAVVVALVPQGLFFMTTASYAMGMLRVAGKGALIQEANAVESTSHANLLCLDKTGTLTTNRLLFCDVVPLDDHHLSREKLLASLGEFAASMGTPDTILSTILSQKPEAPRRVIEEIPFSAEYKWSALRYTQPDQNAVYVLGAPEVLTANIQFKEAITGQVKSWTDQAMRVLLFASSPELASLYKGDGTPQLPNRLDPLGLVIFEEELRVDARQTLDHFAELGVKIKIISGDHPNTVAALAKKVGLNSGKIISGMDLDRMGSSQVEHAAEEASIFGRITPQQKERLVETYRQQGYYTIMIGDGVNDILPIKRAHLGVAMQSGAPATRSIADIVLLGDRFSALPAALEEGQRIVRGMQDVIRLLLTRTCYVFLMIVAAQIARAPFPVTPKHNALIALLTVGIPILAIATWAKAGEQPKSMLHSTLRFVFPAAITISLLVTGVYLMYLMLTKDVEVARTALTGTSILCGLLLLPFVEPPTPWWVAGDELSSDPRPSLLAGVNAALFLLVLSVPSLRDFFELAKLGWQDIVVLGGLAFGWSVIQRWVWRSNLFDRLFKLEDN